jgi:carbon storage regulator
MLILARRIGESIMIGDQVEVSVIDIKGDQVKLGIKAPTQIKVYRREVYSAIQEENRAAAAAAPRSLPQLEPLPGAAPGQGGIPAAAPGGIPAAAPGQPQAERAAQDPTGSRPAR